MKIASLPFFALFLLTTIFLSIGIVVGLVFGKSYLDQAKASEDWPQISGRILESDLEETRDTNNEDKKPGGRMYSAHVVYTFEVDGEEFQSNRLWFGGKYSTSDRAEMFEIVKKYPAEQDVTVYYSANDPSQSVLMPGAFASSYIMYGIGMGFLGIGGLLLFILIIVLVRSMFAEPDHTTAMQNSTFDEFPLDN